MHGLLHPALWATVLIAPFSSPPSGEGGAGEAANGTVGYLYQPAFSLDRSLRLPAKPYVPQPGDIMLATDSSIFWTITHNMAGTGHPHHSAVVFVKPDGKIAVVESGPYDELFVRVLDIGPHFEKYQSMGPVWVRQRKTPISAEQSAALTEWSMRQDGRRFALKRLAGQLTPLRSRGPIRTRFMGGPHGDRDSYFCSELAMETLVAGGMVDPDTTRPAATYPRDIFFGRSLNPYLNRHLTINDCWHPPARWTSCAEIGTADERR